MRLPRGLRRSLPPGETAIRFTRLLQSQIMTLNKAPLRYIVEEREPWKSLGVHRMPYRGFYVYYWIENDTVHVTAVIAMRMDQEKQLRKLNLRQE